MANHMIYSLIIKAVEEGRLKEPFSTNDFLRSCPGLGVGTYKAFLYKHRLGNPGYATELFEQVGVGIFKLLRPYKYQ